MLDQSRSNFINWRNSIARESKDTLRSVILSALGISLPWERSGFFPKFGAGGHSVTFTICAGGASSSFCAAS